MYDYQLYQMRQAEELRRAQQEHVARQAQSSQEAFYRPALAQLGRSLTALGERLQEQYDPRSKPTQAYR